MKKDVHNKSDIITWFKALEPLTLHKVASQIIFLINISNFFLDQPSDFHTPGESQCFHLCHFNYHFCPSFLPTVVETHHSYVVHIVLSEQSSSSSLDISFWTLGIPLLQYRSPELGHEPVAHLGTALRAELAHVEEAFTLPIGCVPSWTGWRISFAVILGRCTSTRAGHTWKLKFNDQHQ